MTQTMAVGMPCEWSPWEEQPMPRCDSVSWCHCVLEDVSLQFSALNLCPLSSVSVMATKKLSASKLEVCGNSYGRDL